MDDSEREAYTGSNTDAGETVENSRLPEGVDPKKFQTMEQAVAWAHKEIDRFEHHYPSWFREVLESMTADGQKFLGNHESQYRLCALAEMFPPNFYLYDGNINTGFIYTMEAAVYERETNLVKKALNAVFDMGGSSTSTAAYTRKCWQRRTTLERFFLTHRREIAAACGKVLLERQRKKENQT